MPEKRDWDSDDDRVLRAIDEYWAKNYRSPTLRWLANETGLPSTNTVFKSVNRLVDDGRIYQDPKFKTHRSFVPHWVRHAINNARSDERAAYASLKPVVELDELAQENERLRNAVKRAIKGYENLIDLNALPGREWDDAARVQIGELLSALDSAYDYSGKKPSWAM